MIKRILIAIAVLVFVTSAAKAAGPDVHRFDENGEKASIKVDMEKITVGWPFEYTALTLCEMPVKMNVGYFVQIKDCDDKKIELKQVKCADINQSKWPCYSACTKFTVYSNFKAELGTKLVKGSAGIIKDWKAYYKTSTDTPSTLVVDITGTSGKEVEVCVDAWEAQLLAATTHGETVTVGSLQITVKPAP